MALPQTSADKTLPTHTLTSFQRELEVALRSHEERLEGEAEFDDVSAAIRRRSEEAHREILAALARIRDGSFGRCERCLMAIRLDRLVAMPHARYCMSCVSREDRTNSVR